jgi:hypothetical protein
VRAGTRVAAFAAALGVTFGAAALAGAALDPLRDGDHDGGGHGHAAGAADEHGGHDAGAAAGALPGLAVSESGLTMVPEASTLPLGRPAELRFRIVGPDGRAVTDMEVEHERRMHLIVVRRDLTGYQHLHPSLDASGVWSARLRLPAGGVYRAYADFRSAGRSVTLATDLFVAGPFAPVALPSPSPVDTVGDYRAELSAPGAAAGATAALSYALSRGGRMLEDIEPYLGADGHLVALREGDLAFLHVHPEQSGARGIIRFGASLPSAGRYRLFLQFKHEGRVRTVAHTLEVRR